MTARAGGAVSVVTTTMPGLTIPAFSAATASRVSPRCSRWSSPIDVMIPAAGVTTLVASSRPPRPTSTTATSTAARRNHDSATAVAASKNVGGWASPPVRRSVSACRSTTAASSRSAASPMAPPSTVKRSVTDTRWGEVYRPARYPAARRAPSSIAATEPLPFVPATMMDG